MFGTAIGSLNVIINEAIVFSVLGDKGDMWHKASINVSAIVGVHKVCHSFRMSYFCVSSEALLLLLLLLSLLSLISRVLNWMLKA